jgi:2-dehydropantoate 2-reductase
MSAGMADIVRASPVNCAKAPDIRNIAGAFNRAGLNFKIVDNHVDIIWNKLIGNTAMAVAAVLGLTNDEYLSYENSRQIMISTFEESIAVARSLGVKFDDMQDPIRPHLRMLESFRAAAGKSMRGSLPLDIIMGRKTEIDTINGAVVNEGRKRGIPTPVNECLVTLVKAMEERNASGRLYNFDRSRLGLIMG